MEFQIQDERCETSEDEHAIIALALMRSPVLLPVVRTRQLVSVCGIGCLLLPGADVVVMHAAAYKGMYQHSESGCERSHENGVLKRIGRR